TRAIGQPVAALKLNGKAAGLSIGLLSAVDDKPFSLRAVKSATGEYSGPNAIYNVLRLKRDFGAQSTAGLVYTDRVDGGLYNRVIGVDTRYVFSKVWYAFAQFAHSFDSTNSVAGASGRSKGALWQIQVDRTGKYYGNDFNLKAISQNFRTRGGFISRANQV